jgi:transcriptional regulator
MYVPEHFAVQRSERLHALLRTHPLGLLITPGPDGPEADHLPFLFDPAAGPNGTLSAHVARANPVWQRCPDGTPVLVVFRGAEGYISPSWYPTKAETHRHVPTWNYDVVHVRGVLTVRDDERFVRGVVARLTRQHEAAEPQPWRMTDAPPDYLDAMLRQVVGIEIAVTALTGKAKLGQNRLPVDRLGAADALQARGRDALARHMRDPDAI